MKKYFYLVEGENEQTLVNTLKKDMQLICSGPVHKINVVQNKVSPQIFMSRGNNLCVILVFDTDRGGTKILEENIHLIHSLPNVKEIYMIPQVMNLEDELKYSCKIKDLKLITSSKSNDDFKRDFNRINNLSKKLRDNGFSIDLLWSRRPGGEFKNIVNDSAKIKLKADSFV